MRKAFGMIQVIFFMLILSGLLTITMKYATITTKQTADLYVKEQAELFMSSAIELALLGISEHNRSTGCLDKIDVISDDKRFEANITITKYYLSQTKGCANEEIINTESSNGMIDMSIVVETNNTHPKNSHPLKLIRRSLQRL